MKINFNFAYNKFNSEKENSYFTGHMPFQNSIYM